MKIGTLLRPHTHEGVRYQAGSVLSVDDRQFAWLVSQGVMKVQAETDPLKVTPKPPQRPRRCCGR